MQPTPSNDQSVKGIIAPSAWDEAHRVVGVSILTIDEDEVEILLDGVGQRLLDCLHRPVLARGRVQSGDCGRKQMRVSDYRLINGSFTWDTIHW